MLFSLFFFSKCLYPARSLCEANTIQPVDSSQKGIALESHTSAGWPLAMWGARSNPCGHPVRSSLGNGIDSKCVIGGVNISDRSKWHLPVFSICTCECLAWVGEMLNSAFSQDQNILPELTQNSKCFSFAAAYSLFLCSVLSAFCRGSPTLKGLLLGCLLGCLGSSQYLYEESFWSHESEWTKEIHVWPWRDETRGL